MSEHPEGAGTSGQDGTASAVIHVVTVFVEWVAHVYAVTAASVHAGGQVGAIRHGMCHEWPLGRGGTTRQCGR